MRVFAPVLALALMVAPHHLMVEPLPETPPTRVGPHHSGSSVAGGADGIQPVENPDEADPDATVGTYVVNEVFVDEALSGVDQPSSEEAQAEIKKGQHVTFKGEIICGDCSNALVITVAPLSHPVKMPRTEVVSQPPDFRPPPFRGRSGPIQHGGSCVQREGCA